MLPRSTVLAESFVSPHAKYPAQRKRANSMPTTEEKIRWRHSNDEKVDILQQYTNWVAAGKSYGKSPSTALAARYNCHFNYPKELFDKVLECGTVSNGKSPGRPPEYTLDIWSIMCAIIDEF